MIESGLAISTIAAFLGLAEQTMRNWLHDFLQTGVASLVYRKPPGRPTRLTKRQTTKQMITQQNTAAIAVFISVNCWAISVSPIKKPVLFLTI